jgi:hypothetical protein
MLRAWRRPAAQPQRLRFDDDFWRWSALSHTRRHPEQHE